MGACHAAALYRYVSPAGVVTYQSSPPPSSARHVQVVHLSDTFGSGSAQAAVHAPPVVLYEAPSCPPCAIAARYLTSRKVHFKVVDVTNPKALAEMKSASHATTIPTIVVGKQVFVGYVESELSAALTAAGYPDPKNPQAGH